jgi:hypothetical protein
MADTFRGTVVKGPFARGSKSEREAVMLDTGSERLVLRQKGGNPFRDPELEALVGRRIEGRGQRTGYTLILDNWDAADEE